MGDTADGTALWMLRNSCYVALLVDGESVLIYLALF
jgi:hypothetical protein